MAWLDGTSPCNGCFCHIKPRTPAACSNNTGYKYLAGLGGGGDILSATLGEHRSVRKGPANLTVLAADQRVKSTPAQKAGVQVSVVSIATGEREEQ